MKKFLALVMVGVMVFGTAAMAAGSPSAEAISASSDAGVKQEYSSDAERGAAEEDLSIGEYISGAIGSAYGIPDTITMGFKQGLIVDGVKNNYSLLLRKSNINMAQSAKKFANGRKILGLGRLVNNRFKQAVQGDLYSKAFQAGQKVSVYQYTDGQWVKLAASVRLEHIDVVLQGGGDILVLAD